VISFLLTFPPKSYVPSYPFMLHALSISTPRLNQASDYAVFSSLMPLQLSLVQILFAAPCSQTCSVCICPLNVRDQVSRPYRTTGKIILFRQQTRRQKVLD
jgi:hypothetical protein